MRRGKQGKRELDEIIVYQHVLISGDACPQK